MNKMPRKARLIAVASIPAFLVTFYADRYFKSVVKEDCLTGYHELIYERTGDFESDFRDKLWALLGECRDKSGAIEFLGVWALGTLALYQSHKMVEDRRKKDERFKNQASQSAVSILLKADNGERILNELRDWNRLSSPLYGLYDKTKRDFDDVIRVNDEILSRFKEKSYTELKDEARERYRNAGLRWPTNSQYASEEPGPTSD